MFDQFDNVINTGHVFFFIIKTMDVHHNLHCCHKCIYITLLKSTVKTVETSCTLRSKVTLLLTSEFKLHSEDNMQLTASIFVYKKLWTFLKNLHV